MGTESSFSESAKAGFVTITKNKKPIRMLQAWRFIFFPPQSLKINLKWFQNPI
jgi:hypothetical protein